MQRRNRIRILIAAAVAVYGVVAGAYAAFELPKEGQDLVYAMESSANRALLTNFNMLREHFQRDYNLVRERYEQVFAGKHGLWDPAFSYRTDITFSEPLPLAEFDAFARGRQESQKFFISADQEFPKGENCLKMLQVPEFMRHDLDRRVLASINFRCYVRDGQRFMGLIWDRNPTPDRRHITIRRLDDHEPGIPIAVSDFKSMLPEFIAKETSGLAKFPGAMQAVLNGKTVISASEEFAPLMLPEKYFKKGENSGIVDLGSGQLLVTSLITKNDFDTITAVPLAEMTWKYRVFGLLIALGGSLLALAIMFCGCREDSRADAEC